MISSIKMLLWHLQGHTAMMMGALRGMGTLWRYRRETLDEMYRIGAQSFPVVLLGGLFAGIILALETGHRFESFGAKTLVGHTVALGMVRELGAVITGLLLAARTGAKNVSELGSMQLSEQIDALRANGEDPVRSLVVPRMNASLVMFLPLTLVADISGILGGMYVASTSLQLDPSFYWNSAMTGLRIKDIVVGFSKPLIFGFFIATISCYFGLATSGGNTGLGRSTINAVVASSIVVLAIDFVFTKVVWELL
ncbi:MAG: ABC transporter permease [Ignavibacteriae bacterium]|nr:ABC transporter permease [Ignavibacteriota bacterium]